MQESIEREQMLHLHRVTGILGAQIAFVQKCRHSCASRGWCSIWFGSAIAYTKIM